MAKKPRFILGAIFLLFLFGWYIVIGYSVEASASDLIPPSSTVVSVVGMIIAIFAGSWYMPEKRQSLVFGLVTLTSLLLWVTMSYAPSSFRLRWLPPALAIATILIVCIAVFWPVRNKPSID